MGRKPADYISVTNNPLSIDLRSLVHIEPPQLRDAVLSAVSASVSVRHCLPNRATEMEGSDPLSVFSSPRVYGQYVHRVLGQRSW
jgi:hypothetical protein